MFSDIRGFTTISEKLDAQDLANFLNQYSSDMTRLVFEHHGTLDKYIGDAVMASGEAVRRARPRGPSLQYGAENDGAASPDAKKNGDPKAAASDIGIGLNTGVAKRRQTWAPRFATLHCTGRHCESLSRLEGLNKDYGTHILVNENHVIRPPKTMASSFANSILFA